MPSQCKMQKVFRLFSKHFFLQTNNKFKVNNLRNEEEIGVVCGQGVKEDGMLNEIGLSLC